MTIFNYVQNFSLSNAQNNIFVDGEPACDIILQKGIKYIINADLTKRGIDKTALWATFDASDNFLDFPKNGDGTYKLYDVVKRQLGENTIYLNYSPDFLRNDNVTDTDKAAVIRAFREFDFILGEELVGENSGARMIVSSIDTFCDDYGNVVLGITYSALDGVFEPSESILIPKLASDTILNLWKTREIFTYHVPEAANEIEINHTKPFIVSNSFFADSCPTVRDVSTFFDDNFLNYDSFSTEKVTDLGCTQRVQNTMTLQYTPDLLKIFCDQITGDWNDIDMERLHTFPIADFLTGKTIFGRHSQSRAIVESISIIRSNGRRFINVCLNGATGDFQPNEPIQVLDLGDSVVASKWSENIGWGDIPNYFATLENYYSTPYFTAGSFDNAFFSGQIKDIVTNKLKNIGVSIDGCVIDPSLYDIEISRASDLYFECRVDRCTYIPDNEILYTLKLFDQEFDIGSTVRVRKNIVPFVERTDDGFCIEVPAETEVDSFYFNIDDNSMVPLRANIKEFAKSSLHYRIDDLLSEEFVCEYPDFVKFFEYYFAYTNSYGRGKYILNNRDVYANVDTALGTFLPDLAKENIPFLNDIDKFVESRIFQKEARNFYERAGSDEACEYFFNILFDTSCDIRLPCDTVFRNDGGKLAGSEWLHTIGFDNSLCLIESIPTGLIDDVLLIDLAFNNTDIDLVEGGFIDREVRGLKSRASGIIESIDVYYKDGCPMYRVEIAKRFGEFLSEEPLEIDDFDLSSILSVWLKNDPRRNIIPGFSDLYLEMEFFLVNKGNLLYEVVVDEVETGRRWNYWEKTDVVGYDDLLCGELRVDCIDEETCLPINLISEHIPGGNFGIIDGQKVVVERKNSIGQVTGRVKGTADVRSMEFRAPEFYSRESFANDIAILDDNFQTSNGFYVLSTPVSRVEYIDLYNNILREAGTLAYSEYPVLTRIPANDVYEKNLLTFSTENT